MRVDGQYGDGIVIGEILTRGVQVVVRCRTYTRLAHPRIQRALTCAPVATITAPESQISYELFEVPGVALEPEASPLRVILTRRS